MKVWEEAKRAEILLNQRFCLFYWYIVYALFYTLLLKVIIDNGFERILGNVASLFFLYKIMHILIVVNPHFISSKKAQK